MSDGACLRMIGEGVQDPIQRRGVERRAAGSEATGPSRKTLGAAYKIDIDGSGYVTH